MTSSENMTTPSENELYGTEGSVINTINSASEVTMQETKTSESRPDSVNGTADNMSDTAKPKGWKAISADIKKSKASQHNDFDNDSINSVRFDDTVKGEDDADGPDFFDRISQYSLYMTKDARYYFQHPYARLFVAYIIIFCNFLIYAEDPVAHSVKECTIPAIGNAFSFVFTKYPPNYWSAVKVLLWMTAIACGLVFGKLVIHRLFLKRLCRLEMFQDDQGSFMVMFLTTILFLFVFSWIYNLFLMIEPDMYDKYALSGLLGLNNAWFMKAAACGTWCGDFFTAWMVTDIMLQEKLYPNWAMPVRRWWIRGYNRIILFWCVTVITSGLVVIVISTDIISWDMLNRGFLPSNEISRAMLASFILLMDLTILMQDWDFPHFVNSLDIKLPGLNVGSIHFTIPKVCKKTLEKWTIHIEGKWFQYGVIFLVMILDLNMWKNQVFYNPYDYGQYTDPKNQVYTVSDQDQLAVFNKSELTYDWRTNNTNPLTNETYITEDTFMYSTFVDFHIMVQVTAFIPSMAGAITFITLIIIYGRVKPSKKDPYVGRLHKRPKGKSYGIFAIVRAKLMGKRLSRGVPVQAETSTAATGGNENKGADVDVDKNRNLESYDEVSRAPKVTNVSSPV